MNLSRPSAGPLARTVAVIAAVAGFTIATPLLAATSRTTVPLVVAPRAKPTERAIQLVAVGMQVEVAGTLATTRVELAFLNPNTRQLEGELQFPLGDDQEVTGFALESLDGLMMPAVPVEKARGQEVFEAIERRAADPALLEQTAGNNFRLRIYPLLPGKPRKVSIEITELLRPDARGRLQYALPFAAGKPVPLKFTMRVHGRSASTVRLPRELAGATVLNRHGGAVIALEQPKFASRGGTTSWAADADATVFTDRFEGEDYFYAELPVDAKPTVRPDPAQLAIVWDASGSGAARDHEREFEMLDAYFAALGRVDVTLVVARDRAEASRTFTVTGGDWSALRAALASVAYDGASNVAAWTVPADVSPGVTLLFSDGLGNWGDPHIAESRSPLYAISASTGADANVLRALAERSAGGGRYLDLLRLDANTAAAELRLVRPGIRVLPSPGLADVVVTSRFAEQGRLRVVGRVTRADATLRYRIEGVDGAAGERQLAIEADPQATELISDVAAKRWARARITQLELDAATHRAAIERLGLRFGVVSSRTSLIVLERLEDFVEHDIVPPAGPMRAAFLEHRKTVAAREANGRQQRLDRLAARFAEVVKWWETDFPKDGPPKPAIVDRDEARERASAVASADQRRQSERAEARPLAMQSASRAAAAPPPMPAAAAAPAGGAPGQAAAAPASIRLQKWAPDTPEARRLREAGDAGRYAVYLDQRPGHVDSPAFFLDAADVFFDRKQDELALRVLSNLVEMNLESRQILRIAAYRLIRSGQVDLALPLLRKVLVLAPFEPQSWRDLGLALAAHGDRQEAVDALRETATREWDARFGDIDLTALAELNALVATSPGIDTSRIDPRVLRNLPLALRVVLSWDADNTDIDLWVVDPDGEKTYYGRPLSWQGGRLSSDFTGGYGPETFSLKVAKPGRYEVRAQFYGHRQQVVSAYTTLMLRLSTDFGTAAQKDEDILLRLTGTKDEVLVGSFEVGGTR